MREELAAEIPELSLLEQQIRAAAPAVRIDHQLRGRILAEVTAIRRQRQGRWKGLILAVTCLVVGSIGIKQLGRVEAPADVVQVQPGLSEWQLADQFAARSKVFGWQTRAD